VIEQAIVIMSANQLTQWTLC